MLIKNLGKNKSGRDFVVGDLHGCIGLLRALLDHVNFSETVDRLISVGDLIDRGSSSLECLRLTKEPWFHHVIGNHEDLGIMANRFNNKSVVFETIWEMNGGNWFYEASKEEQIEAKELLRLVNENSPLIINVEMQDGRNFHVLHAELQEDCQLTDNDFKNEEYMSKLVTVEDHNGPIILWGRSVFRPLLAKELTDKLVQRTKEDIIREKLVDWTKSPDLGNIYVGHTILNQPTKIGKLVNIDTGAFLAHQRKVNGLTLTEPLTNKFWTVRSTGVSEVKLVEINV